MRDLTPTSLLILTALIGFVFTQVSGLRSKKRNVRQSDDSRTTLPSIPDDTLAVLGDDSIPCIFLQIEAGFTLEYKPKTGDSLKTSFNIPDQVDVAGSCEGSQSIALSWKNYKFSLQFGKNDDQWWVEKYSLEFNVASVFKNSKQNTDVSVENTTTSLVKAPLGKSFSCRNIDIKLNSNENSLAYAVLNDIKIQPYLTEMQTEFGEETICNGQMPERLAQTDDQDAEVDTDSTTDETTDDETSDRAKFPQYQDDTAAVAVGSFFAIVTFLVVSAYGIYRYFILKKVDYNEMG